ncbi:hypothetical protein BaRGS_00005479 [Batillaria attramentaria]|uniref:Uncharacterized protein n=1 Tax=Batillaria attramentaria TaxID=370345 RepID=A0ABD0LW12_9CAEN
MPKKPPPAIPGLDDLPKVPIPKGFDRARFVRVKPDNKASLNRKKRDKSPAPKAGAQPQGSPPQPQQHPPEQHPHPPQSSQPQPTQQPQQTPSVEVPPTTESTPEPSLQQPRPEQTKLEVAPSAQPLKKTPSIRICGVKVKEASAMYAPLSLKSDQQKAEKNKKTSTPEARAEAYIRERFFVKRKPPNFDVVFTRALNPPFNTTTDPEQHKTFVSMYGKMPIY